MIWVGDVSYRKEKGKHNILAENIEVTSPISSRLRGIHEANIKVTLKQELIA